MSGMKKPISYAEVDRRCEDMKRRGRPKVEVATARAKMWMEVEAYRSRKRRLAQSVSVPNPERLDVMRTDIALAYGVRPADLFDKTRGNGAGGKHVVTAARRSFVVAARRLGYSTTELAMYLRRPGAHSSIIYMEQQATGDEKAVADAATLMDADRHHVRLVESRSA